MECSFCNRSDEDVTLLIAGPPPHFICEECTATVAKGMLAAGDKTGSQRFRCSFCAAEITGPIGGAMGSGARICESCISVCLGILEGQPGTDKHQPVIDAYKRRYAMAQ